jgi:hypothetical protein
MGNSRGGYRTTSKSTMAAYDKLPPTARFALQYATFDWATQPIWTKHRNGRRGYMTGADIAKGIARLDANRIAKDRRRHRNRYGYSS